MDLTANHYALLLGLQSPWKDSVVELDVEALRVDIRAIYEGENGNCLSAGKPVRFTISLASVVGHLPHADIVHDQFHISQHLGNAVDKMRRIEHAKLQKQGDESLTKTKYLWLKGMESLSDEALSQI